MSGGGGSSNTVQKSDPWWGITPYLLGNADLGAPGLFNAATNWYNSAQTVAEPSAATTAAENATIARATQGSPLEQFAKNYFSNVLEGGFYNGSKTINGDYLNSNPYLSGMVDANSRDILRNYTKAVMPSVASQFASAGRYGSGQQLNAINNANETLANQLSDVSTNIYAQNYENERNRQEAAIARERGYMTQAGQMLPQLAGLDYQNINALAGVGAQQDARAQRLLDSPLNKLVAYGNILAGGSGMGGINNTTQSGSGSFLSNALGATMLGNSLYGLGSSAGLWGGAAGLGALGSMGLGSGAMLGGATGLATTGALGGVSAGTSLFSTAAPMMALML